MSGAQALQPEPPPKKRKKKTLLLIVSAVVVLAGAGGGGFFLWRSYGAEAATPEGDASHAEAPPEHGSVSGALSFEPFVVNLADAGSSRYLKADVRLLVSGVESVDELKEDEVTMLRLRSTILEYLSHQTSDVLVTPDGKEAVKTAIAEQSTKILEHAKVVDVLFSEFVVQY